MEIFVRDKFENYNLGRVSQNVLETVCPQEVKAQGCNFEDGRLCMKRHISDTVHNADLSVIMVGHVTSCMIKKEFIFQGSVLLMLGECCFSWFSRCSP